MVSLFNDTSSVEVLFKLSSIRLRPSADTNSENAARARAVRTRLLQNAHMFYLRTISKTENPAHYRPSRTHVAAKAPSNSNSPISPANMGSTPTPLTTLASRILTPSQPSPR
jgi:hypothetical protein